jgi:RNA-directed DNA polymerase
MHQDTVMNDICLSKLIEPGNLRSAWARVRDNHGCHGVDGVTITRFESDLEANLALLSHELAQETYHPLPLMRILVDKGNGESRRISVPAVRDRVAQAAALNVLEPLFEAEFERCSFAYRRGRSWQQAVYQVREYYEQGYQWVVDADIDAFFDSVPHDKLMSRVKRLIQVGHLQHLIGLWVKAEIWDGEKVSCLTQGIPQGSVISPILANLYLDEFDEELLRKGLRLVRYADDFVVLCKTYEKAQAAVQLTEAVLGQMALHLDEVDVVTFDKGFRFLGVIFSGSAALIPFDRQKKTHRVIHMPPPLDLKAYRDGLLS